VIQPGTARWRASPRPPSSSPAVGDRPRSAATEDARADLRRAIEAGEPVADEIIDRLVSAGRNSGPGMAGRPGRRLVSGSPVDPERVLKPRTPSVLERPHQPAERASGTGQIGPTRLRTSSTSRPCGSRDRSGPLIRWSSLSYASGSTTKASTSARARDVRGPETRNSEVYQGSSKEIRYLDLLATLPIMTSCRHRGVRLVPEPDVILAPVDGAPAPAEPVAAAVAALDRYIDQGLTTGRVNALTGRASR